MAKKEKDLRDFRYEIKTPSGEIHIYSGKRTYQYLCAAAEANGEYPNQARESAIATMQVACGTRCNLLTDLTPAFDYMIQRVE